MAFPYGIFKRSTIQSAFNERKFLKSQLEHAETLLSRFSTKDNLNIKITEDTPPLIKEIAKLFSEINLSNELNDQRIWETEGLTKFNAILRDAYNGFENKGDKLLSDLCEYIGANQACLLLAKGNEKDEKYLEMICLHAYGKKKYKRKKVEIGEGIVGEVFLNQSKAYLTEVPEEYINIGSGLGEARATALLLVPLTHNNEMLGVLELAGFKPFEQKVVEFVDKLGSNIASTLFASQNNEKTERLLVEFQEQAEMLRAQEEEMRQNSEELLATQEEMARKQDELIKLKDTLENDVKAQTQELLKSESKLKEQAQRSESMLSAIQSFTLCAEFEMNGAIISVNEPFLEVLGMKREEVLGLNHRDFDRGVQDMEVYQKFWLRLKAGIPVRKDTTVLLPDGREIILDENYIPLLGTDGKPVSVINISMDVTENKNREKSLQEHTEELRAHEEELKQSMEELQATHEEMNRHVDELHGYTTAIDDIYPVVEFDEQGKVANVNTRFCKMTGYSETEIIGQSIGIFVQESDMLAIDAFAKVWSIVKEQGKLDQVVKRYTKDGQEFHTLVHYRPFKNTSGQITRIICICEDYSDIRKKLGEDLFGKIFLENA
ncbi:hypothetical protein FUAX_24630 [Fulvitalea axinellae]|uniref:PAS domain-containing protein n=1 Tax=Fulvitalea axinellae TaxID=1182444 RepID=A0AAU9DAQ3_9BACT|nr:hypothetical protein FUAX_24630 [Fulvitalea axinellae]